MRNLVPLCLLALITAPIPAPFSLIPAAHAQNQTWITQFGTSSSDYASALAPDGEGGTFVGGSTKGSLGGPFAGGLGIGDAWLARYDDRGNQLWIRQFGTIRDEIVRALAPDGVGGVMVTGYTRGSLGGPNPGCVPAGCSGDAFLARYDGAGNQLWIRQFGDSADDAGSALAPDGEGGVFVAGGTDNSLAGPNAGCMPQYCSSDVFLARYDANGNRLWIRQFGTSAEDSAFALAPDGAGGVMITGWTHGSLGGPNAGLYTNDVFLARYDSAGNQLWIRQFGTSTSDDVRALAPDGSGGVMIAGGTNGSLGGPNAGRVPGHQTFYYDVFLARYDADGRQLWLHQFGTSQGEIATALAPDGEGGVMVAGTTNGELATLNPFGQGDVFLARYSESGERIWIRQFGTNN
ncbi:MAG: SBBP repeat-containing protein, partial [Planctomycetes bacterium]|nr:SBBP repeat-containing protein [Planctomycetota bacterium]